METISEARQRALEAIAALDDASAERIAASARKEKAMRDAEAAGLVLAAEVPPAPVPLFASQWETLSPSAATTKPGIKSTELWLATLLPVIAGAVVQLGWLSEQAATELGMVGGGSYVLGRSLVKSVMEWRKR